MTRVQFDPLSMPSLFLVIAVIVVIVGSWAVTARRIKRSGPGKWHPRPPNLRDKVTAGVWGITVLIAVANHYADWGLFGSYGGWVLIGVGTGCLHFIDRMPKVIREE